MHRVVRSLREVFALVEAPPQVYVFLPALFLAAYWEGGESAFITISFCVALFGIIRSYPGQRRSRSWLTDPVTGLRDRSYLADRAADALAFAKSQTLKTAAFQIEVEEFAAYQDRFGHEAASALLTEIADRLGTVLRSGDSLARLEGPRFGLVLHPVANLTLQNSLGVAARLQTCLAEPFRVDGATLYLSISIGISTISDGQSAPEIDMLTAAEHALIIAKRSGPGAVRVFSPEMQTLVTTRKSLSREIEKAMEVGQIRPWFQPQICLKTGVITGFEALARWDHPERGTIPPAEFLPIIEDTGMSERLSEAMLYGALTSLSSWDKADLDIPAVSVNFSVSELQNPRLIDRIRWHLDRFALPAHRLVIEVLETVVSHSDDDIVAMNLRRLADYGCLIDLDDFGTGQSSIVNIRRFSVSRIKVDRSFVSNLCEDSDQQKMVRAILTMATQLGIDTLAEGIETAMQLDFLARAGCSHGQGFGIAKPLPPESLPDWVLRYRAQHQDTHFPAVTA